MVNRVLIADDHALVREGIGILISRGGFTVVAEASNGQEALAHASSYQPDMAVLDMSMPIINGLETAQETAQAVASHAIDRAVTVRRRGSRDLPRCVPASRAMC